MQGYVVYIDSGVVGDTLRKAYSESGKFAGFARYSAACVRADAARVFVELPTIDGGNVAIRLTEIAGVEHDGSIKDKCIVLLSGGASEVVAASFEEVRKEIAAGYAAIDTRFQEELKASEESKNDLETEVDKRIESVLMTVFGAWLEQEQAAIARHRSLLTHLLSQMGNPGS